MHTCSKCGIAKTDNNFQLYKDKPSGQCRQCKTENMKANRLAKGTAVRNFSNICGNTKLCMECKEYKDFTEFSPAKRGLNGLAAYCKKCMTEKYNNKITARKATAKYRKIHKEMYLAKHRIAMYERKQKIKVTDDETVTKEFLINLYATEICCYCKNFTPVELRTADHKIPLNKNGIHSATNLIMACFACNSSKRNLTDEEFIQKRKQ